MDIFTRLTPKVAEALYLMRTGALVGTGTRRMQSSHGGSALRISDSTSFKIGGRVIHNQVAAGLIGFIRDCPQFFRDAEDGVRLSLAGMNLWLDKGNVYVFASSEAVDDRYAKDRADAKRKRIKAQKFPTLFLIPSTDMLVYADNYIEHNLAMHGMGTTGEPALQIPTPQEPEWWQAERYVALSALLLGKPGRLFEYLTGRGIGDRKTFRQTEKSFEGVAVAAAKVGWELMELGLPVPK